ncbi:hypothetical protein LIER_31121 [Lithospermum erythrorhizon]|uniref:Reverse transcriptase zinc-binding domain-containing protein n=1 Tax=Lithospermum erythrorhizon TaxID=34254 RepID=A0AAV3RTY4_LITER
MEQHVLCKVVVLGLSDFYLTRVYGANVYGDRSALWKSLVDNRVVGAPWVIAGDFNIFKDPNHFKGGKLPENVAMEEFKSCIDELDVTELAGHGYVHVQPPEVSDHCLLSIHLKNDIVNGPKSFKYHRFWEEHPGYTDLIRCCWEGYDEDGSDLDGLIGRLRKVKEGLNELNRSSFVDISGKVHQCVEELREVQEQIYNGDVNSELMCKERNLMEVFVRSVVAYTQRHKISMIEDLDGVCHKDPVQVEEVIVQFYRDLFTSKGSMKEEHRGIIKRTVTARVPEEYWNQLVAVPGLEEVRKAFHVMASGKSPGPDGFSADFYKHNWGVVNGEVYKAVVPLRAKLSEVEWGMPGARRQTVRLMQSLLWADVRYGKDTVSWGEWLWSSCGIPKFAFIVWLLLQNRLSTKDRLCHWGMEVDPHCVLCGGLESHDHLFFECSYTAQVWRLILQRLGEYRGAMSWAQERLWVEGTMGGRSFKQRIKQVAFVSAVAVLWEERNLRCFQGTSRECSRVV